MTKPRMPPLTDDAEARIQSQIAADPDSPELTDAQIAAGGPASEMLPPALFAALARRGRPKSEAAKRLVTLRLDPAVLDAYRSGGPGWQVRMGEVLAAGLAIASPRVAGAPESHGPIRDENGPASRLAAEGAPPRKRDPKAKRSA